MSSITMSKSETVVLFDLIGASSIPVGVGDLPNVNAFEYKTIMESFFASHIIAPDTEPLRLNKGLEQFLQPIVNAKTIMIFNSGIGNECTFNATLYFALKNLVAILDNPDGSIMFLTLESVDDLLLFIPDILSLHSTFESYVSYILMLDNGSSIIHCSRINLEKGIAKVVEGKRTPNQSPLEADDAVGLDEYKEMLQDKLKEVYDAACC